VRRGFGVLGVGGPGKRICLLKMDKAGAMIPALFLLFGENRKLKTEDPSL
jgi:hypothetical protein